MNDGFAQLLAGGLNVTKWSLWFDYVRSDKGFESLDFI